MDNTTRKTKSVRTRFPLVTFPCHAIQHGDNTLVLFSAKANELWELVQINRRDPDKDKGYQRILSGSRVRSIANFIKQGNPIPITILVAFDKATLSEDKKTLSVERRKNAGWVIDGQHRLAGAHESGTNIDLPIIAFLNLDLKTQIKQFVTINKEAKGVPSSLYIDLLKHLPKNSDADVSKSRAADIADSLRRDEDSPFFNRITIIQSPSPGELSLTNFARKVAPLVAPKKGLLNMFTVTEQIKIFNNYYKGLGHVFPAAYRPKEGVSIFFKTLGFGAMMNVLPTVFNLALKHHQGFKIEHVIQIFKQVDFFDFDEWNQIGTGSEAESQAADDLRDALMETFQTIDGGRAGTLSL